MVNARNVFVDGNVSVKGQAYASAGSVSFFQYSCFNLG
jgi:hypothetical protein